MRRRFGWWHRGCFFSLRGGLFVSLREGFFFSLREGWIVSLREDWVFLLFGVISSHCVRARRTRPTGDLLSFAGSNESRQSKEPERQPYGQWPTARRSSVGERRGALNRRASKTKSQRQKDKEKQETKQASSTRAGSGSGSRSRSRSREQEQEQRERRRERSGYEGRSEQAHAVLLFLALVFRLGRSAIQGTALLANRIPSCRRPPAKWLALSPFALPTFIWDRK